MDLTADAAFAPGSTIPTRSHTSDPAGSSATVTSPLLGASTEDRRDSGSTIRPTLVDAEGSTRTAEIGDKVEAAEPGAIKLDQASLEQEVGQVVQQISSWGGSFWGGFKKQSASALDAVKKDLARTVSEAQDEIKMLQTQASSFEVHKPDINLSSITAAIESVKGDAKVDKGKGREIVTEDDKKEDSEGKGTTSQLPTAKQTQDFFKNLQSSLAAEATQINANMSSNLTSLQKTLSESIANNPSLAQINRANISTLSSTIQQNLEKAGTRVNFQQAEKLAEGYLKRGEHLLEEAGTFLKDAVKVVPPIGDETGSYTYSWDGIDVGLYDNGSDDGKPVVLFDGSTSELSRSQLRLNALLRRLRTDVELLMQDPSSADESEARQKAFAKFKSENVDKLGGYQGDHVQKAIWAEMGPEADAKDVESLKATKDAIVATKVSEEVFWTRYLFHKNNIQDEEKKRQQLLQATQPKEEEDFNWDDGEGDEEGPKSAKPVEPASTSIKSDPVTPKVPQLALPTPAATSGAEDPLPSPSLESADTSRRESEESYDIVSEQSGGNGRKKVSPTMMTATATKEEESDEDSDWE